MKTGFSTKNGKNKKTKKEKKNREDWDKGQTVAPMTAPWMPWNRGNPGAGTSPGNVFQGDPPAGETPGRENEKEAAGERGRSRDRGVPLTRAERRSLLLGAFRAMLPVLVCFALVAVFLYLMAYFWLK